MAEPEQNQAPDVTAQPAPGHLGDFGYVILALAWAVVVIAAGMWLQSR